jgi:hypothetical protein
MDDTVDVDVDYNEDEDEVDDDIGGTITEGSFSSHPVEPALH